MKRLVVLACVMAMLIPVGGAAAQGAPAAKQPAKKAGPTVAEAQKFLGAVETRYFD